MFKQGKWKEIIVYSTLIQSLPYTEQEFYVLIILMKYCEESSTLCSWEIKIGTDERFLLWIKTVFVK